MECKTKLFQIVDQLNGTNISVACLTLKHYSLTNFKTLKNLLITPLILSCTITLIMKYVPFTLAQWVVLTFCIPNSNLEENLPSRQLTKNKINFKIVTLTLQCEECPIRKRRRFKQGQLPITSQKHPNHGMYGDYELEDKNSLGFLNKQLLIIKLHSR